MVQPELEIAELFASLNQVPHQVAEATIFGDLLPGAFHSRTGGNDVSDGLAFDRTGERERRPVAGGAFLGAMARRFAALAIALYQRARAQVAQLSEFGPDVIAFAAEKFEGMRRGRHRGSSLTALYAVR